MKRLFGLGAYLEDDEYSRPGGVMLPNRRYVQCGEIALVPKHAIKDMPSDAHKIEQGYYNGHVEGFGGTVDAR